MRRHTTVPTPGGFVLGLITAALLACAVSPAFVPAAGAPAKADASFDELKLEAAARKALLQDKRLGGLNVGVTVRDRVATLWGPLPSAEAVNEALERLKQVPGIVKVVDTTKVSPPADP